MLDVDPDSWKPPEENAHLWLAEVMNGIVGYRNESPKTNDAVLEAHTTVLEVVVDYLVADRRRRGGGGCADDLAPRVMAFFPKEEKGKRKPKMTEDFEGKRQHAKIAVETSARWAVDLWGWTVSSAGAGAGEVPKRRRETPALVRARLLAARLLAEVVETCGLPEGESCAAILEQMNSFAGVVSKEIEDSRRDGRAAAKGAGDDAAAAAVPGAVGEGCRGLGAAARGGLVRALLGRPFCAELARVLCAELPPPKMPPPKNFTEVDRLRARLERVLGRAQGGADALLVVGDGGVWFAETRVRYLS